MTNENFTSEHFIRKDLKSYVEARLEHWADWYSKHNDYGLGYRRYSTEYQLMRSGGDFIRGTQQFILPSNKAAEQMELFVSQLADGDEAHKKIADVLRHHYFTRGNESQKAKAINMSTSHYRVLLGMAKYWLEGRLCVFLCPKSKN